MVNKSSYEMSHDYAKLNQKTTVSVQRTTTFKPSSRVCRCFVGLMAATAVLLALCVVGLNLVDGGILTYPLHAQCSVEWKFNLPCDKVASMLQKQIKKWTTKENCAQGGEKCLYQFVSYNGKELKAKHLTPVKLYVDDITITFNTTTSTAPICQATGYSRSETWYAHLDYSTNYCNLRNLADGAGLTQDPKFIEKTSDSICTQYTSRNCEKY